MNYNHIERSLDKIRAIFIKTCVKIDELKPGEKLPAVALAETIAKEVGLTGPVLYPTLKFLFDGYPDVEIRRGAKGGIFKL